MSELGNAEILQPEGGYRYSLDPFLLADFVETKKSSNLIDLGTGNGILPILLVKSLSETRFVGIDIQRPPLLYARKNAPFATFIQGDIRQASTMFKPESFDIIVSNPPYRKLNSGKINRSHEIAIARHEIKLTLSELVASASHLLEEGGIFYFCHLAARSREAYLELQRAGFGVNKVRYVQSRSGETPFLVMLQAIKGAESNETVIPPLTVYRADNNYTDEMLSIYDRLRIQAPVSRNA